jgi:hypothetical protein
MRVKECRPSLSPLLVPFLLSSNSCPVRSAPVRSYLHITAFGTLFTFLPCFFAMIERERILICTYHSLSVQYSDPAMKDLPNMGGTASSPSSTATPAPDSQPQLQSQQQLLQSTTTPQDPFHRPPPMSSSSTNSSSSGSTASINSAVTATAGTPTNANGNVNAAAAGVVAVNWVNSALRVLWDKWRWGAVIVLAVIVSRVSSK